MLTEVRAAPAALPALPLVFVLVQQLVQVPAVQAVPQGSLLEVLSGQMKMVLTALWLGALGLLMEEWVDLSTLQAPASTLE